MYFYSSINIIIYANQLTNKKTRDPYEKFISKSVKIFGLKKILKIIFI